MGSIAKKNSSGLQIISRSDLPEIFLIIILLLDLFTQVIPIVPMVILIMALQFVRLDLNSNIIMCIQYLSLFFGAAMNTIGVAGVGGLTIVLGALLLLFGLFTHKTHIRKNSIYGFFPLLAVMLYFLISMLLSTGGDFAGQKYLMTLKTAVFSYISFSLLFSNFQYINAKRLGIYLMLYSAYLLRLSILTHGINGPDGVLDFGFMRTQTINTLGYDPIVFWINYQFPGAFCLQGLTICLMDDRKKTGIIPILFLLSLLITLYAGARQMIVILFLIIILWSIRKYKGLGVVLSFLLLLAIPAFYAADTGFNKLFEGTVERGYIEGGGRGAWLLAGVSLFLSNPLFGVGFGRYNLFGDYETYPHNIIIELLSEVGIVGLVVIVGIVFLVWWSTRKHFKDYLYLFFVLTLMSMASGGMYDNIVVFTLVFASLALSKRRIRIIIRDKSKKGKNNESPRLQADGTS